MNTMEVLQRQYNELYKDYGDRLFGVFVYGSQNYKLDNENSDVDTITLIFPTKEEVYLNEYSKQRKVKFETKSETKVLYLNVYIKNLIKPDLHTFEITNTQYRIVNEEYLEIYGQLSKLVASILHENELQFLRMLRGRNQHSLKRIVNFEDENDYRISKKTSYTCHYLYMIRLYMENKDLPLNEILTLQNSDDLEICRKIKESKFNRKEGLEVANKYSDLFEIEYEKYKPIANFDESSVDEIRKFSMFTVDYYFSK